ncbi:hypothetical protein [Paucibacter sp. KBW04]|uniref:hypothetical protein n=1 Tax=Paucibacter sp. KBW04 TaxID=2153361 RepID=UPI000F56D10C|nr:hypothetical protein [Paucibacter sp. KBW04]
MKSKAMKFVPSAVLLATALLLAWPHAQQFLAVDACLDSGGSYNYTAGACDHQASHPHAATAGGWSLWLAAVLVLFAALAPYLIRLWIGRHALQQGVQRDGPASSGSAR